MLAWPNMAGIRGNMFRGMAAGLALVSLAACGPGGSPAPTPAPAPAPVPTPTPTPTPTPLATCATAPLGTETFPAYDPGDQSTRVAAAVQVYHAGNHTWKYYHLENGYQAGGEYPTFSSFHALGPGVRYDVNGVPEVLNGQDWVYNPVTIAQYSFYHHTLYLRGTPLPSSYWAAIGKLQQMVGPDGALRYDYEFQGQPPGWVSAMAQGQALSAFARAYALSGDPSLIQSGNAVLDFMLTPVAEGGTRSSFADLHPSLDRYVSLLEYNNAVSPHTLNGFLFTIFGLYDWSRLAAPGVKAELADAYFQCGVHSVASTIHYYDIGGYSVYDLREVLGMGASGVSPIYHKYHITLLVSLNSIAPRPEFLQWAGVWADAVGEPLP